MNDKVVITCVYCGHAYPDQTPTSGADVLTDHIKVCPKHPMRKAEAEITLLRKALIGLVGVETKADLEQMAGAMRFVPAPDSDKVASINAIHALLMTMPEGSK